MVLRSLYSKLRSSNGSSTAKGSWSLVGNNEMRQCGCSQQPRPNELVLNFNSVISDLSMTA